MDSFYDQPRVVPTPTSADTIAAPLVPEVSLIFQTKAANPTQQTKLPDFNENCMSYNVWKARKQPFTSSECNKENNNDFGRFLKYPNVQALCRKQVRFQGPVVQQQTLSPARLPLLDNKCSNNNKPKDENMVRKNLDSQHVSAQTTGTNRPFEQIYMANIPNRHLDLSIIEPVQSIRTFTDEKCEPTVSNNRKVSAIADNKNTETVPIKSTACRNFTDTQCGSDAEFETHNTRRYFPQSSILRNSANRPAPIKNNAVNKFKPDKCCSASVTRSRDNVSPHFLNENFTPSAVKASKDRYKCHASNRSHSDTFNSHCLQDLQLPMKNNEVTVKNKLETQSSEEKLGHQLQPPIQLASQEEAHRDQNFVVVSNQRTEKCKTDDPTVRDLLKIIQQQNEQLMLLQKQVASLLESKSHQKQIEPASTNQNDKCITSTQIEPVNMFAKKIPDSAKPALPKFAIDVMTSFEVSIRAPQTFQQRAKFSKDLNHEPKIQEITETESNTFETDDAQIGNVLHDIRSKLKQSDQTKQNIDDTISLNEPLKIQEDSPSPENSIHVDMQDYSSDSNDESSTSSTDIGWTIYNNVMGQVNNILKKTQQHSNKVELHSKPSTDKCKSRTMQKVKEATLRHLKSIGVDLPSVSDDSIKTYDTSNELEYSPTEISFAVKQLLMKYLPDEQLAKILCKQPNNIAANDCSGVGNLIKRRPEFSFATLQYMKKYNLLTSSNDGQQQPETKPQVQTKVNALCNVDPPKILDITALKQQPKLL